MNSGRLKGTRGNRPAVTFAKAKTTIIGLLKRVPLPQIPQLVGAYIFCCIPFWFLVAFYHVRNSHGDGWEEMLQLLFLYLTAHGLIFKRKWGCVMSLLLWLVFSLGSAIGFKEMYDAEKAVDGGKLLQMLRESDLWLLPISVVLIIYSFRKHWPVYPWRYVKSGKAIAEDET